MDATSTNYDAMEEVFSATLKGGGGKEQTLLAALRVHVGGGGMEQAHLWAALRAGRCGMGETLTATLRASGALMAATENMVERYKKNRFCG